jgi:hypothetical protein
MAKAQKPPPQGELCSYLRDLLTTEAGLEPALAARIAGRCVEALDRRYFSRTEISAARSSEPEQGLLLPEKAFDPFSFGAVALLMTEGRPALAERLAQITRAEDLHLLARSQRLTLDPGLTRLEDMRTAIIESAERRIAARRRAAAG